MGGTQAKKLSYTVNSLLLAFVVLLMLFFRYCQATILVYFSIPTIAVYVINYLLIYKGKLSIFVWIVYFWIALYMGVTTVCLGYSSGFHLYVISLIPVIFYTEYMAYQLQSRSIRALWISIALVVFYIVCSSVAIANGAIYSIGHRVQMTIMSVNALTVFSFIISYTVLLIRMIIGSEEKLKKMALSDKLTGLYNRHYMIEQLNNSIDSAQDAMWIAMIDIDDFKSINDRFGHNAGDFVLINFGKMMSEVCKDCVISRWGGEEYLIMAKNDKVKKDILEVLRKTVCEEAFIYQDKAIQVSITIGAADYQKGMTLDNWIQEADSKLYIGKNNGKNQVVL